MQHIHKFTRKELLAIGRKDLEELVDFALGLQEEIRAVEILKKEMAALRTEVDKLTNQ